MLTTYPDSNNLSTYAASFSQKADFGRFHSIGLQFDDYTATSHGLTVADWGGNRTIRTATRRRHAGSQLLMLPNPHRCRCGECRRDRKAWLRCPWAVAGPGRASRRGESYSAQQAPLVRRAPEGPEGLAAVPVGGGGAWPRCWSAAAGPGRASRRRAQPHASTTGPTGVEGAGGTGGPGCGARGRWRGLAGLRDDAPSEARGADGERAGRRPRAHTAARPDTTRDARNTRGTTSNTCIHSFTATCRKVI